MSVEEPSESDHKTKKKPGKACDNVRQALKQCLKESDCVQKERRPAADCLQSHAETVPTRCFQLFNTFNQCKLSMVDNRLRVRGKKLDIPAPADMSTE